MANTTTMNAGPRSMKGSAMPEEQVARFIRDMRGMLDAMEAAGHD
jgi:hypothetical protein